MTFGAEFQYDTLKDELIIGQIYVRVYNEQPTYVLEVINQQWDVIPRVWLRYNYLWSEMRL